MTAVAECQEAKAALAALRSPPLPNSTPAQSARAPHQHATSSSGSAYLSSSMSVPFMMGLMYSNAGILVAALLLACSLLWASMLGLPYTLIVCWGLWSWSRGSSSWVTPKWVRMLQLYCGVHITLLYLAQVPLLQLPAWQVPCDALGLYWLAKSEPPQLVIQLIHMVCLHLLYMVLGVYTGLVRQQLYKRLWEQAASELHQGGQGRRALLAPELTTLYEPLMPSSPILHGSGSPPTTTVYEHTAAGNAAAGQPNDDMHVGMPMHKGSPSNSREGEVCMASGSQL